MVPSPLPIWATALSWGLFGPSRTCFSKKAILPRRKKALLQNVSKSLIYSWGFIRDPTGGVYNAPMQRLLKSGPSPSSENSWIAGGNIDFRFYYTPECMVSSRNFQKFSGEGLTESPPQTPPPLNLGLRPRFGLRPQFAGASHPRFGLRPQFTPSTCLLPPTEEY